MTTLATKWAGSLYGTNTGNLFLVLTQTETEVKGLVRVMDHLFGLAIYELNGTFDGTLRLTGIPAKEGQQSEGLGNLTIQAVITPDGNLLGEWQSTIGTAGTFNAYPHDRSSEAQNIAETQNIQEQFFDKNIEIGSVRLISTDVHRLISLIQKNYTTGQAIVTYYLKGFQVTKYATELLGELETLGEISYLKIAIQEPEFKNINKIIVLELTENGSSSLRVSGANEAWVLGIAESIYQELRLRQNSLITKYRKHGLNLNGFIFFLMLVFMPEITELSKRAIFGVTVFLLLNLLLVIHRKFIPNTKIYLLPEKPSPIVLFWPSIVSWTIAASSSLFAAWIFYLLTRNP